MTAKKRRFIIMLVCVAMCCVSLVGYYFSNREESSEKYSAKEYILENHNSQTGALNAVTSIYLNYRLWDTLFEAMVLMLSALAVITFSWSETDE
ncbi:MAG: hydrogen gas-evolving membrane-bound hydrogenase subunit E [Eubacteriales bacterium]